MNKLISRNPVQRFKQGRKIVKALEGTEVPTKTNNEKFAEFLGGMKYGFLHPIDNAKQVLGIGKSYPSKEEVITKNLDEVPDIYDDSGNMPFLDRTAQRRDYGKGEVQYKQNNGIWYARWTNPNKANQGWYKVAEGSTGYNRAGDHNVLRNGRWEKIVESNPKPQNNPSNSTKVPSSFYMFGKMGGWNRSMGNTITDQESLNYLKEMGLDGQNALQIQQYINQQLGNNSVKEDNKWGNQSRAGLKALYDNWKMQQKPQTPASPIGNSVIESQRALEEIPQLSQDQLMFNNINSKTFNAPLPPRTIPYDRSMTRDIIKDITGNSAYNFTGDQRKALRQYLNGEQYDQEAIKAFGNLNQYNKYMKWRLQKGGILPSRNIVERFKQRNFS